jgi:hypothetical protein
MTRDSACAIGWMRSARARSKLASQFQTVFPGVDQRRRERQHRTAARRVRHTT